MLSHWIWLSMRKGLSLRQQLQLVEHFSDPEDIYYCEQYPSQLQLSPKALSALEDKDLTEARAVQKRCIAQKINIVALHDAAYPRRLRNIPDPPLVLYYMGVLPDFEGQPVIGVVGTRKATPYGMHNAKDFSGEIAACGGLVVSGGAAGIDAAALQGALAAQTPTVAVLGCGPDVDYPKANRALFKMLREQGCILSEYLPGTPAAPWQFPARNRIISGLSDALLVIEAPERSGALITARNAMEQGREIFAVPGNIDSDTSAGSNALLRDGATAAMSGWDVLRGFSAQYPDVKQRPFAPVPVQLQTETVEPQGRPAAAPDKKDIDNPGPDAYSDLDDVRTQLDDISRQVLSCVGTAPTPVDEVIAHLDMPAAQVLQVLMQLELIGVIQNLPGRMVSVK